MLASQLSLKAHLANCQDTEIRIDHRKDRSPIFIPPDCFDYAAQAQQPINHDICAKKRVERQKLVAGMTMQIGS